MESGKLDVVYIWPTPKIFTHMQYFWAYVTIIDVLFYVFQRLHHLSRC